MENVITPSWVQVGELGLAFVVIILCSWLILYVMKSSEAREKLLMTMIETQQSKMTDLSTAIQQMTSGVGDIVDRLEAIEEKVNITHKKSAKRLKPN